MIPRPDYFVLGEHTLGYIDARQPHVFCILHASILRGSTFDRLAGITFLHPEIDTIRPATPEDFESYRVCSKGHL
ncbi:hypothetical protein [Pararhizobium haloflavum]|uniref:hypothetical protein n=1 Tax=Pararhizobium haloflavum TaxID=2037914 RepID=UPI000C17CEB2|nr:hypothetical protein [Pararhizobium haloflavum]